MRAAVALAVAIGLVALLENSSVKVASATQRVAGAIAGEPEINPQAPDPVSVAAAPLCPLGQLPQLRIQDFPASDAHGAATPELAVRERVPGVSLAQVSRFGASPLAPAWLTASTGITYVATILRDGTWFAAPATLTGCLAPPLRTPHPAAGSQPIG